MVFWLISYHFAQASLFLLKYDKNKEYLTRKLMYIYDHMSVNFS
jgi:hypothetical protein